MPLNIFFYSFCSLSFSFCFGQCCRTLWTARNIGPHDLPTSFTAQRRIILLCCLLQFPCMKLFCAHFAILKGLNTKCSLIIFSANVHVNHRCTTQLIISQLVRPILISVMFCDNYYSKAQKTNMPCVQDASHVVQCFLLATVFCK